jgi:hypothetical protein
MALSPQSHISTADIASVQGEIESVRLVDRLARDSTLVAWQPPRRWSQVDKYTQSRTGHTQRNRWLAEKLKSDIACHFYLDASSKILSVFPSAGPFFELVDLLRPVPFLVLEEMSSSMHNQQMDQQT